MRMDFSGLALFFKKYITGFDNKKKAAFVNSICGMLQIQLNAIDVMREKGMITGKPTIADKQGRLRIVKLSDIFMASSTVPFNRRARI